MRTQSKLLLLALLAVAGSAVAAGAWNAAQYQTLFEQIPAPPATLAQAGASVGLIRNPSNNVYLAITDPALRRSRAAWHAGMDAINQAGVDAQTAGTAAAGIDVARMQSDPAYAQQIQQKMASMSQAEKMQMAMQMTASRQQSQQATLANPAGMRAGIGLIGYLSRDGRPQLDAAETGLREHFAKLVADYDGRHAALDQQLQTALKACPVLPFDVCHVECGPDLKCLATIQARVPALIAAHRKLAAAELAEETALFTATRSAMQPVIAKTGSLTAAAEAAGAPASQRQSGYTAILSNSGRLQVFVAKATQRAGFWQNIQQKIIPDSPFAANVGNLGYQYRRGKDDVTAPPSDLPKDW
ncbi:MAG: hypothetical protein ACRETW_01730 [Stenotrophobium sp.]